MKRLPDFISNSFKCPSCRGQMDCHGLLRDPISIFNCDPCIINVDVTSGLITKLIPNRTLGAQQIYNGKIEWSCELDRCELINAREGVYIRVPILPFNVSESLFESLVAEHKESELLKWNKFEQIIKIHGTFG